MSWRSPPPAFSPVHPRALAAGMRAIFRANHSAVVRTREQLRERYQARQVILTDSGTSALVAVFRKLLPRGGCIAYPGFGCIDLTAAAVKAGIRVRLYDLDPETMSPDLDTVRRVLQRGVDAILVAHLYGYVTDVPSVRALAREYGVLVIEDAAQAAGARLNDRPAGALADVSILSFGRGKGLTAGSGGAILTYTPALDARVREITPTLLPGGTNAMEVAALTAQYVFARPLLYKVPASIPALGLGEMTYRPAGEPRAMSPIAASILYLAIQTNESELAFRRKRANQLLSMIAITAALRPITPIRGSVPGYLRLPVICLGQTPEAIDGLGAMRSYPMTLDQHPQLQALLVPGERAGKGAERLRDKLLTLPTHSRTTEVDMLRVQGWLSESFPQTQSRAT